MKEDTFRVAGLDGGGTHTRYLLADGRGTILGSCEGGAGLLGAGDDALVADRILEGVRRLVSAAAGHLPIDVLCAGLAGAAGRPESRRILEERLSAAGIARRVLIVTDSEVAFLDAFGAGDGILIIAGTGSVAMGRSGSGTLQRVGGWGILMGDEGSGYSLGLGGLRAAVRGDEGRGPKTSLTPTLFSSIGVASPRAAFEWSKAASKADIGALARHVVEEADGADPEAAQIVDGAVHALLMHAQALRQRIAPEGAPPPTALVGGLIEPGGLLRPRLTALLAREGFQTLDRPVDPARGSVRMALEA